MTLSERLAQYISETSYDSLPREVQEMAIRCVYNYMGCACAGTLEPEATTLTDMWKKFFPEGKCHLFASDKTADPATAALINGTAGNALGYDDMYREGLNHPGVATITAALTIADIVPVTGKEFITGIVVGYEVFNRLSHLLIPSHYKYWHVTATAGTFGAAAVAASMMKLSPTEIISALGAAGTQAAGLQECVGNMNQRSHHGIAARNGVLGALMASQGYYGAPHILDGPAGLIRAMSDFDGDCLEPFADLGTKYLILDTSFKFYPCCGHIHGCAEAAIEVAVENDIQPADISRITVGTYKTAITNSGNPNPQNVLQAKFSVPYCVAKSILERRLTMQEFVAWPPSAETLELMGKIELMVDDEVETAYGASQNNGGVVTVFTKQGKEFSSKKILHKGDPEVPLTLDDLLIKFRSLCHMAMPMESVTELEKRIAILPELPEASVLTHGYL